MNSLNYDLGIGMNFHVPVIGEALLRGQAVKMTAVQDTIRAHEFVKTVLARTMHSAYSPVYASGVDPRPNRRRSSEMSWTF